MTVYAPALVLVAATLVAWFIAPAAAPAARVHLRFAAVLLGALAAPLGPQELASIVLIVMPLALAVLGLAAAAAWAKPVPPALAAIVLGAVTLAALVAALLGWRALAFGPGVLAVGVLAMLALHARSRVSAAQGLAGAGCFLATIAASARGDVALAVPLFAAAGLLGLCLALARSDVGIEEGAGGDARAGVVRARRF